MVGNDANDDLACMELGMDAYLITDFLVNSDDIDLTLVKQGSFSDFYDWAKTLMPCEDPATDFETGLVLRNP